MLRKTPANLAHRAAIVSLATAAIYGGASPQIGQGATFGSADRGRCAKVHDAPRGKRISARHRPARLRACGLPKRRHSRSPSRSPASTPESSTATPPVPGLIASPDPVVATVVDPIVPSPTSPPPVTGSEVPKPGSESPEPPAVTELEPEAEAPRDPEETGIGTTPSEPEPPVVQIPEPELPAPPEPTPFRFFSPHSVWNEPIANAPVDPASAEMMRVFNEEIAAADQSRGTPGTINTTKWSVPVYTATAGAPTVKVTLTNQSRALQSAFEAVPLPANALPAAGSDGHLVLWQPSTDRLWEFWQLRFDGSGGWQASWGGAMQHASENPGYYGPEAWPGASTGWGASASSLSIAGGLITLEDLEMGQINHALAMSLPAIRRGIYSAPAERTDGQSSNPLAIPMGAHLRLDPNLDLSKLNLPPMTLMMAEAAQKYGIIVRDSASNIAFYGQDPTPTGTEPYGGSGGYYGRLSANKIVAAFPWSHLEALQMTLHSVK